MCRDELSASNTATETFQKDAIKSLFFSNNRDVSEKVLLWQRDGALPIYITIVNTINECLTGKNPLSETVSLSVGPDLKEELQKLQGC